MTEAKYPYTAEDGECQYKITGVKYAASGFLAVPEGNETLLTEAIVSISFLHKFLLCKLICAP